MHTLLQNWKYVVAGFLIAVPLGFVYARSQKAVTDPQVSPAVSVPEGNGPNGQVLPSDPFFSMPRPVPRQTPQPTLAPPRGDRSPFGFVDAVERGSPEERPTAPTASEVLSSVYRK